MALAELLVGLGGRVLTNLRHIGRFTLLLYETLRWALVRPFRGYRLRWSEILYQMSIMGAGSLPIVALISGLVGLTLAMQGVNQMQRFGAEALAPAGVAILFCRELGPLMVAIILSGRVGASIAAELGTMKVSEEVDALEVMALNPVRFLVVPRLLAIVVMTPLLTALADMIGMLGGMFYTAVYIHMDPELYKKMTVDFLDLHDDLLTGLYKSVVFGAIVGSVGCYKGLNVSGGAEGVGRATTDTVVMSIFLIIVSDSLATAITVFWG